MRDGIDWKKVFRKKVIKNLSKAELLHLFNSPFFQNITTRLAHRRAMKKVAEIFEKSSNFAKNLII